MRRGSIIGLVLMVAAGAGYYFYFARSHTAPPRASVPRYVDPATCATCHRDVTEAYLKTGMGRSFFRPRPENTIEDYARSSPFYHKASDRYYQMVERDGKYYQRRYQIGFDSRETNVVEKEIHFVMGSGNHARTYLHRTPQGKIVQLPLG